MREGGGNTPQQSKWLNILFLIFYQNKKEWKLFFWCMFCCLWLFVDIINLDVLCPLICYLFFSMSCLSYNSPTLPFFKGKYGFKNCCLKNDFNILLFHAEANFTASCPYCPLLSREHASWSLNKAFINVSWLIFKHYGGYVIEIHRVHNSSFSLKS